MALVPEIKLIRTDTTLDLSQKAEKVCLALKTAPLYRPTRFAGETGMRKLFLKIRARARARAYWHHCGDFPKLSGIDVTFKTLAVMR